MLLNRIFSFKSRLSRLLNSFSSAKQESIIGIDLGTTNSCVAIMQGTTPKVIQNSEGARTTPSIVAFTRQGARLVGNPAKRQAITNSQNTIFAAKRLIGRQFDEVAVQKDIKHLPYKVVKASNGDAWIQANGQSFSPSQIGAFVLTKMKQTADQYLGKSCHNAVVTVPAYFNDSQRQATKDAGRIAGLNIKRIINEPTAAALAYGIDKEDNKTIAVYDLGGGTFDVSILEIKDGVFEVKATNGDTSCGGEDADAIIQQFLIAEFKRQHKIDIVKDKTALQRFRQAAQKAKIQLSQLASTEINLPFITNTSSGSVHFTYNLTRVKLQSLMDEFLKKTIKPCENCIKDAGITKNKIEEVILVGGMSRMPKVQKLVQDIFGKVASKSVNPDEVVAVGAAIQGGVLKGDVKDLILLDVTPLTLGIEVLGGVFLKIIPRNSSIPIKRTKEVVTVHDGQTEMSIKIYQGERDVARDNKYLGQFLFRGIIAAPKGVPKIQVIFSIDANGILLVEAIDKITRKRYSTTIQSSGGLSSFEIQQMLKKAKKYKEDDKKRRQFIDLKNQSESLVGNIQDQINEHRSKLSQELLSEVESSLENLKSVLESSTLGYKESDQLVNARENAHKIHLKIGEFIYNKNAQQQSSNDKK